MNYAIIGSGKAGRALAKAFARKKIAVAIASRRPLEALAPIAKAIGPTIIPKSLKDALKAEIILLAIPFGAINTTALCRPFEFSHSRPFCGLVSGLVISDDRGDVLKIR